ncbi:MAG: hypothetical protein BWY27_00832 [Bacteroidetes bacterium ADurb.Bin234]|nr:MAG: hypothetical protein BWY27_00832 [Bacteroidetes bacterium ADurb.Bin234]
MVIGISPPTSSVESYIGGYNTLFIFQLTRQEVMVSIPLLAILACANKGLPKII